MTPHEEPIVTPPSVLAKAYRIVVEDLEANPVRYLGLTTMRQRAAQLETASAEREQNVRIIDAVLKVLISNGLDITFTGPPVDLAGLGADIRTIVTKETSSE